MRKGHEERDEERAWERGIEEKGIKEKGNSIAYDQGEALLSPAGTKVEVDSAAFVTMDRLLLSWSFVAGGAPAAGSQLAVMSIPRPLHLSSLVMVEAQM